MLTPAELSHLISAYCRLYPNADEPFDVSPVGESTRQKFVEMGVIYQDTDGFYRATAIGERWLERILATPDPVEWEETH